MGTTVTPQLLRWTRDSYCWILDQVDADGIWLMRAGPWLSDPILGMLGHKGSPVPPDIFCSMPGIFPLPTEMQHSGWGQKYIATGLPLQRTWVRSGVKDLKVVECARSHVVCFFLWMKPSTLFCAEWLDNAWHRTVGMSLGWGDFFQAWAEKSERIPGIQCLCASGPLFEGRLDLALWPGPNLKSHGFSQCWWVSPSGFSQGLVNVPFLRLLDITFKYLLEIISPPGWCSIFGHLPTPEWNLVLTRPLQVDISVRLIQSQTVRSLSW